MAASAASHTPAQLTDELPTEHDWIAANTDSCACIPCEERRFVETKFRLDIEAWLEIEAASESPTGA